MGIFFFQPGMVSAPCARSRARSSSSPGLAAPPRSPSRAGRGALGAVHRGWGAEAAPGRIEAAPRAPRSSQTRRRLRVAAAGPGRAEGAAAAVWPGGRAGGGGRLQAESRDCGAPGRWVWAARVGSRRRLRPLLLLLLPLPCLLAASRWDSEPPPPHKALPAAGLRLRAPRTPGGGASPETRARLSGHGGGARAHTLRAPGGRPARYRAWRRAEATELAPLLPPQTQTGGSTGLGNDLAEVGGSVLPFSPSSRRSPPRPGSRPLPPS